MHHIADYAGPYAGSFIPMLVAATREAADRGHRTTLWFADVARDRPWLAELDGLAEIRWLRWGLGQAERIRPTLQAFHAEVAGASDPIVVHTHFSTYDIPAALVRLRRPGAAVFWHEHGRVPKMATARARSVARYALLGRVVSGMLCVSPDIAKAVRSDGAPARRVIEFPNAIDLGRFAAVTPERRALARTRLGIPDDRPVLLHFGWDWQRKGGDLMVAAAERLGRDDAEWLTVGVPPETLPPTPARVRALRPTDDVRHLYAAADVFVSCSRAEGMPYAVLEALASGLPVVGTDLPGQTPLLTGLAGTEVVAADPAAIARGALRLLSRSPAERARQSLQARERVADRYSLPAWARRLIDLYERAHADTSEPTRPPRRRRLVDTEL